MHRVYLDHSATTPVRKEVADLVLSYMTTNYGNPSSIHSFGREAKKALENAREQVAGLIGAKPKNYFTSGGTEADNLAVIEQLNQRRKHLITWY